MHSKPYRIKRLWATLGIATLASLPAHAEDVDHLHGIGREEPAASSFEGGITAVFQHARDSRINNEVGASFDLVASMPAGPGAWTLYLEGNTSPREEGVSSMLGEANKDAGTALSANGNGRLQISEFHYSLPAPGGKLTAGLIDPAGFFDTSAVANDEGTQFLGTTLVNNPTIGFPDYTLGVAYVHEAESAGPGFSVMLAGSHGLADNEDRSYPKLFRLGQEGKGLFTAAELVWGWGETALRIGTWLNSADHDRWDGSGTDRNYGVYGVVDWPLAGGMAALRVGLANEEVAEAENFVSLAWEHPWNAAMVGVGIGRAGVSDKLRDTDPATFDDLTQAEIYVRFDAWKNVQITPSLQFIRNSGFDRSDAEFDRDAVVAGLRMNWAF